MNGVISKIKEEGPIAVAFNEGDRLAREGVGEVLFLINRLGAAQNWVECPQTGINKGVVPVEKAEELVEPALEGIEMFR